MNIFNEKKTQFLKDHPNFDLLSKFPLECFYNLGDELRTITGIEKISWEGDKTATDAEYEHQKGQVALIDFWVLFKLKLIKRQHGVVLANILWLIMSRCYRIMKKNGREKLK